MAEIISELKYKVEGLEEMKAKIERLSNIIKEAEKLMGEIMSTNIKIEITEIKKEQ